MIKIYLSASVYILDEDQLPSVPTEQLIDDVKSFLTAGLSEIPSEYISNPAVEKHILNIIFEEFMELVAACSPEAREHAVKLLFKRAEKPVDQLSPANPIETKDALVDLAYVVANGVLLLGLEDSVKAHYRVVHHHNMHKVHLNKDQALAIMEKVANDGQFATMTCKEDGTYVVKSSTGKIPKPIDFPTTSDLSVTENMLPRPKDEESFQTLEN